MSGEFGSWLEKSADGPHAGEGKRGLAVAPSRDIVGMNAVRKGAMKSPML